MKHTPPDNQKYELFSKLCSDLDLRDTLFTNPANSHLLNKLELRDFPLKKLLTCPPFVLDQSLVPFDYAYAKIAGKRDRRALKVSVANQVSFLKLILSKKETSYNSLYLVTGITDFEKAKFFSFLLAFFALKANTVGENTKAVPLYYNIKGGFDDLLRDKEEARLQKGDISLLILDGLCVTSSKLKIEKIVDLLNIYSVTHNPTDIIILAAGLDPLKLAAEWLNTSFQAGFYFNEGLINTI